MTFQPLDSEQQNQQDYMGYKQPVPNETATLVLGILSILGCICYGLPGIIMAIIALFLAHSSREAYFANPNKYSRSSYNNMNAGRICAIIGLSIGLLFLLFYLILLALGMAGELARGFR